MPNINRDQAQALKSLTARIAQLNNKIGKTGLVLEYLSRARAEAAKLEKKAKGMRLKQMSRRRKGLAAGRGSDAEDADLDEVYESIKSLERKLEIISQLRERREEIAAERRRAIEQAGIEVSLTPEIEGDITKIENRIAYVEECIDKVCEAARLYNKASAKMKNAGKHITSARKASTADIFIGGGILGMAIDLKKHGDMKKAKQTMGPAKGYIKKANRLLESIDLKGSYIAAAMPEISLFMDLMFDGFIVDGAIHDKISAAETKTASNARRLQYQAKNLKSIETTFREELQRLEDSIAEQDLKAETASILRALKA